MTAAENIVRKWIILSNVLALQRAAMIHHKGKEWRGLLVYIKAVGTLLVGRTKACADCVSLIGGKQQGSELTQFEWIWPRLAINHHSSKYNDCWQLVWEVTRGLALHPTLFVSFMISSEHLLEQNVPLSPYDTVPLLYFLATQSLWHQFLIISTVRWRVC